MHLVRDLISLGNWRAIFGAVSKTLKDHELILRFLALRFSPLPYKSPMKDFLTQFAQTHRAPDAQKSEEMKVAFTKSVAVVQGALGKRAFRLGSALNAAVFDSVLVGVSERMDSGVELSEGQFKQAYDNLLVNKDYLGAVGKATAREDQVATRLRISRAAFAAAK